MARIARFAVPGLPHHVTQRGNRREPVFFGDDDYELYRDLLAGPMPATGRGVLGLFPYAYPCPPHPRPRPRGVARAGARRDPSPVLLSRQRAAQGDRTSLPVALRLGGDGRGSPDGGGALCRAEPGPGGTRGAGRRLALVERAGASRGPRRRARQRCAAGRSAAAAISPIFSTRPPRPGRSRSCGPLKRSAARSARPLSSISSLARPAESAPQAPRTEAKDGAIRGLVKCHRNPRNPTPQSHRNPGQ